MFNAMRMKGRYDISWPGFEENRTKHMEDLLRRNQFVDVTLVFDDDEQLEAHKMILSSSSSFFQRVLEKNNHQHPLIYLRGVKKRMFQSMLDFIYAGEVALPAEHLDEFIATAKDLKIKGILDKKGKTKPVGNRMKSLDLERTTEEEEVIHVENVGKATVEDTDVLPVEHFKINPINAVEVPNKNHINTVADHKKGQFNTSVEVQKRDDLSSQAETMLISTAEGHWICTVCRFGSVNKESVLDHAENHIPGVEFRCEFCGRRYAKKAALTSHLNRLDSVCGRATAGILVDKFNKVIY